MSDNKYINTYIDLAMATLHDNINVMMQLRTKEKLSDELLLEKDKIISELTERLSALESNVETSLNTQIASLKTDIDNSNREVARLNGVVSQLEGEKSGLVNRNAELENEKNALLSRANNVEGEKAALLNKANHLDTALHQVSEMKKDIIAKNGEIESLKKTIEELSSVKPAINTPSTPKRKKPVAMKEEEHNDF